MLKIKITGGNDLKFIQEINNIIEKQEKTQESLYVYLKDLILFPDELKVKDDEIRFKINGLNIAVIYSLENYTIKVKEITGNAYLFFDIKPD